MPNIIQEIKDVIGEIGFKPEIIQDIDAEEQDSRVVITITINTQLYTDIPFLSGGRIVALFQSITNRLPGMFNNKKIEYEFEPSKKEELKETEEFKSGEYARKFHKELKKQLGQDKDDNLKVVDEVVIKDQDDGLIEGSEKKDKEEIVKLEAIKFNAFKDIANELEDILDFAVDESRARQIMKVIESIEDFDDMSNKESDRVERVIGLINPDQWRRLTNLYRTYMESIASKKDIIKLEAELTQVKDKNNNIVKENDVVKVNDKEYKVLALWSSFIGGKPSEWITGQDVEVPEMKGQKVFEAVDIELVKSKEEVPVKEEIPDDKEEWLEEELEKVIKEYEQGAQRIKDLEIKLKEIKKQKGKKYELVSKFESKKLGKDMMDMIKWDKKPEELEIDEITQPMQSGKFDGVSIGRDKDGYYVCTHRARSKSYPTIDEIPKSKIDFIESTGSKKKAKQEEHIIELKVSEYASEELLPLLRELKFLGDVGASRGINIEDWEGNTNFGFDGDGASAIFEIKLDGKKVSKREKKEESVKKKKAWEYPQNLDEAKKEAELIEELAKLEHDQWIEWSKDIVKSEDINEERKERWEKLWVLYNKLSEEDKDKDREWARKVLNILNKYNKSVASHTKLAQFDAGDARLMNSGISRLGQHAMESGQIDAAATYCLVKYFGTKLMDSYPKESLYVR